MSGKVNSVNSGLFIGAAEPLRRKVQQQQHRTTVQRPRVLIASHSSAVRGEAPGLAKRPARRYILKWNFGDVYLSAERLSAANTYCAERVDIVETTAVRLASQPQGHMNPAGNHTSRRRQAEFRRPGPPKGGRHTSIGPMVLAFATRKVSSLAAGCFQVDSVHPDATRIDFFHEPNHG